MPTTALKPQPTDIVKVWDGKTFTNMTRREALVLVKEGTHQIATGLSADKLKWPKDFEVPKQIDAPAPSKPTTRKKRTSKYDTRELRAAT